MTLGIIISDAGKELFLKLMEKSFSALITRWSKFRAEQFFVALIDEMKKQLAGVSENNFNALLLDVLDDDKKSEVLFEAYRQVSLSASKELGPRIIGMLTARIIVEERKASVTEQIILMAAEALNDSELRLSLQLYCDSIKEEKIFKNEDAFEILLFDETVDLMSNNSKLNISPINFSTYYGSYAEKLYRLGIIDQKITEKQWSGAVTSHYYDGEVSEKSLFYYLILNKEYFVFFDLIDAAIKMGET